MLEIEKIRILHRHYAQIFMLLRLRVISRQVVQIPRAKSRLIIDANQRIHLPVRRYADRAARIGMLPFDHLPMACSLHARPLAQQIDFDQRGIVQEDRVRVAPIGGQYPGRNGIPIGPDKSLSIELDWPSLNLSRRRIIARQFKNFRNDARAALRVEQRRRVRRQHRPQLAIRAAFQVPKHPMLVFACHRVEQPALFVRRHVDDALPLERHPQVLRLPRSRVIHHHVPARVFRCIVLLPISLLAADVDLARGGDEVPRVYFGLRRVTSRAQTAQFVGIDHDRARIEFDEVRILPVFRGADVNSAVEPFTERKISRFVVVRARQHVIRGRLHIGRRLGRLDRCRLHRADEQRSKHAGNQAAPSGTQAAFHFLHNDFQK